MNRTHWLPGARALLALGIAGLASLALPPAATAQPELGDRDLASVTVFSGGVELRPLLDYREAIVTVAGNGFENRLVFEPGERIEIGTFDLEGEPLGDGVYRWELELLPDEAAAIEMRIEATLNGGTVPKPWPHQSGSFAILGGVVASTDLGEGGYEPERSGLEPGSFGAAQSSASFSRVAAPLDDDAAVGSAEGVEAAVQAAAAREVPAAVPGLGREGFERSDAAAQGLGQSPEQLMTMQDQLPRQPAQAPAARRSTSNDGADGRPRPDEDQ